MKFLQKNNLKEKLEENKNPGLGIRKLHDQGINGNGVCIAIIDQKLLVEHGEYSQAIFSYEEIGKQDYGPQMHASGVTSILVGKECGVVPDSRIVYKAVPCGRDFIFYSQALEKIMEQNVGEPIRVASCSIGFSEDSMEKGIQEWKDALSKAENSGVIVVHPAMTDIDFLGGGMLENKEDIDEFQESSWLKKKNIINRDAIHVPSDFRTVASEENENAYRYDEEGGISWSIPFLAGVIAMMLQVNPLLTREQLFSTIRDTVLINKNGMKIINPIGCVNRAKEIITQEHNS